MPLFGEQVTGGSQGGCLAGPGGALDHDQRPPAGQHGDSLHLAVIQSLAGIIGDPRDKTRVGVGGGFGAADSHPA